MFLFRGGDTHVHTAKDSEEEKAYIQSWMSWMQDLGQRGILAGGEPLQTTGKQVSGKDKIVADGPFSEGQAMVGGYLVINALDIDEAVAIAKGCPIFNEDGKVEVRPLQNLAN